MEERSGITTFKGGPVTLLGPELRVGDKAPDFRVMNAALEPVSLSSFAGKTKILCTVPSIDTPVCDAETRRFNQEAIQLSPSVVVLIISMDLPFAQKRWCASAGIDRVITLSDYQTRSFGYAYGVVVKELMLLSRAVFVVDGGDTITYVQHVPEITQEPNYGKVLEIAGRPEIPTTQLPGDGFCGGY